MVNFARQETGELVKWVRRRFRALGKDIDGNLASELIFLCGDLMTNLIGEIEKIGAYAKGAQITRADIDAVAPTAGHGGVPHDRRHRSGEI